MKRERLAEAARLAERLASECPSNVLGDMRPWVNDVRSLFTLWLDGGRIKDEVLETILVDQVGRFADAVVGLWNIDRLGWTREALPKAEQHLRTIADAIRASLR